MNLMLIEDDREAAQYVVKGLRESGYAVDHAADGRDGLFQASEKKYDMIIVDRMLPHLDGLSIVQMLMIRRSTAHKNDPGGDGMTVEAPLTRQQRRHAAN